MIRAISHALPVTSNTTRSSVVRLCAKSSSTSGRVVIRPADRTLPSSAIATSQKSRCTSSPIDLTFDPFVDDTDDSGELWANDTDGSALAAQPGQSQGAATDLSGSDAHRRKRPAHVAFSRRPLEPSSRTVVRDPDGALGAFSCPDSLLWRVTSARRVGGRFCGGDSGVSRDRDSESTIGRCSWAETPAAGCGADEG